MNTFAPPNQQSSFSFDNSFKNPFSATPMAYMQPNLNQEIRSGFDRGGYSEQPSKPKILFRPDRNPFEHHP
jgi:hypothetical protein